MSSLWVGPRGGVEQVRVRGDAGALRTLPSRRQVQPYRTALVRQTAGQPRSSRSHARVDLSIGGAGVGLRVVAPDGCGVRAATWRGPAGALGRSAAGASSGSPGRRPGPPGRRRRRGPRCRAGPGRPCRRSPCSSGPRPSPLSRTVRGHAEGGGPSDDHDAVAQRGQVRRHPGRRSRDGGDPGTKPTRSTSRCRTGPGAARLESSDSCMRWPRRRCRRAGPAGWVVLRPVAAALDLRHADRAVAAAEDREVQGRDGGGSPVPVGPGDHTVAGRGDRHDAVLHPPRPGDGPELEESRRRSAAPRARARPAC